MRTAVDTDRLPESGDVVLLKSEEDYFAVLDVHPDTGWRLIRIVRTGKLGRYRSRYPGPSMPIGGCDQAGLLASSFVRETKTVAVDEVDQFLAVEGSLRARDLRLARELTR